MKKKKFNQKELKSLEAIREMVNSTPIQPIYKGTFLNEFHLIEDANDAESAFWRFVGLDDDEINQSDEFEKKYKETLKQNVLTVLKKMAMEEVEKIKAVKKDIERDLETIRKKTGELKQLCDFIENVEKLFDRKA